MIPVIGIGSAFQASAQRGAGPHATGAPAGFSWQQRAGGGFTFGAVEGSFAQLPPATGPLSGGGVVMWHTRDGALAMAGLPAPPGGVQYAAGSDSDDPDAEESGGAMLQVPSMGEVRGLGLFKELLGASHLSKHPRCLVLLATFTASSFSRLLPPRLHPHSSGPSTPCSCSWASA